MSAPKYFINPLPKYNTLFYNQRGWIGADGSYSVALSNNVVLWLYGDTFIGNIINGKRKNATMINNSIALQCGKDPLRASVEFFWNIAQDGKPAAFITPANNVDWFWPSAGIVIENRLYIFLMQIIKTDKTDKQPAPPFDFKLIGIWLAQVKNPDDHPLKWRITQHKIPWGKFSTDGNMSFGSAFMKEKDFVYIYGYNEDWTQKKRKRSMVVARVPANRIIDFEQWRFFSDGYWQTNTTNISKLFNGIATEYSVSYQSSIKQYIVIYSENGMSKNIISRFSPMPTGPWSNPYKLYECPEYDWHQNYFCYGAKAHPTISKTVDQLIITYVCKSTDFWQLVKDARIYWPRFLNIKI